MKVYAGWAGPSPPGWVYELWVESVLARLETGLVTDLMLERDMSDDGSGEDVLRWIEEAVATRGFRPPAITVRVLVGSDRERMQVIVRSIERFAALLDPAGVEGGPPAR